MMKSKAPTAKTGKEQITSTEYLRAVPYRNEAMGMTQLQGGGVLVSVPMKRPKYMIPPISWLLPYSTHRRVELDALGAEVLDLCDGKRTVETVIEAFADRHRLSFREGQLAVSEFLRQLTQRGLTAIVGLK